MVTERLANFSGEVTPQWWSSVRVKEGRIFMKAEYATISH